MMMMMMMTTTMMMMIKMTTRSQSYLCAYLRVQQQITKQAQAKEETNTYTQTSQKIKHGNFCH
jgi:hypothetical protein